MANLPFSLLGGVLVIGATGIGLSLGSLVGLVTVFGISARNAILQLAHYEHMVEREAMAWDFDLVLRGLALPRHCRKFLRSIVTAPSAG